MTAVLLKILTIAYGGVGVMTIVAYWPTIVDLYKHKKPSANVATYGLWTLASGIGLLYSIFILTDPLFRLVAAANFFPNALVLFLRFRLSLPKKESTPS